MTTVTEPGTDKNFVRSVLPWLVAGAVWIFYLLTINHWLAFGGMGHVARATGQIQGVGVYSPLFYLLTWPFKWLPQSWVPLAFNLFSSVCGALALALLARSVALLPHDRTKDQRDRETSPFGLLSVPAAWVPPVLAVLACGLQLTFWENATNASGDIFDLLLFAYAVRCLLEFRIGRHESWLLRAVMVYAAGMADTWALVALAPAFLISLAWIKGRRFFRFSFLLRLFLFGVIGLLFYLVLPLIHLFTDGMFWLALKANLAAQKSALLFIFKYAPHYLQLLMALTSLLPVLVIGIQWKAKSIDPSRIGSWWTTWTYHLAHAALLAACVWVAFDPSFSMRHAGLQALPLNYLGALSVGYFAGYFLLVFRRPPTQMYRTPPIQKFWKRLSTGVVYLLLVLVPAGLIYKNIPSIRVTNGPALRRYASLLTAALPPRAVVLSDDPTRLFLAESSLAGSGRAGDYIFVDTRALKSPVYHAEQRKKYPAWPAIPDMKTNEPVDDMALVQLLAKLSQSNPIYYLHPSFGYYFEYFYPVPHGLVYELKLYPTNTAVLPPPITHAEFAENEKFWKDLALPAFEPLAASLEAPAPSKHPGFRERFMTALHIPFEPNATAEMLGSYYSRSLDYWGVQAETMDQLEAARAAFREATRVNPDNAVAQINLEFNRRLRDHQPVAVGDFPALGDRFGKYRDWLEVITANGPFDDPTYLMREGMVMALGGLHREAAQTLERVLTLVPDNLTARFWLAKIYVSRRLPDKAQPLLDELNRHAADWKAAGIAPAGILELDFLNQVAANRPQKADELLQRAVAQNPADTNLLALAAQLSVNFGRYSNALAIVNQQLKLAPDEPTTLVNKGYLELQLGDYPRAVAPLSRALELQPTNYLARLDRAIAYLRSKKLDEARRDYSALEKDAAEVKKVFPSIFPIYYGLGDIAYQKKDTNTAIHYYELYLASDAPSDSDEARLISQRLKSLKAGSH